MHPLLWVALLGLLGLAVPPASADDPCIGPAEICASIEPTFCLALTRTCHGADGHNLRGIVEWAKDQVGPCTCDPDPEPW